MTKQHIENILVEYGVQFTDALAERLLSEINAEQGKIMAEIEQIKPYDLPWDKRTPENIRDMALEIVEKYAEQAEIQADYDRQKASGMTDEEWEYGKSEQAEDVYDKVLAYLKANVDDFPDYHEAIEAVLKMKGGE